MFFVGALLKYLSSFDGIDGLLLIYDMMIFLSGYLSGFRIFSGFFRIFIKCSDFSLNSWFNSHKWYDNFIFRKFIRFPDFSGFLLIFVKSSEFLHRMNGLLLTYDMRILFFGNLSGFRIFSGSWSYLQIYSFIIVYSAHEVKIFIFFCLSLPVHFEEVPG